jgi:hypothetical protein
VPSQGFDRAGLGQAGQAFQQQVPVGQQPEQDLADHLVLAQHAFGRAGLQGFDIVECSHAIAP